MLCFWDSMVISGRKTTLFSQSRRLLKLLSFTTAPCCLQNTSCPWFPLLQTKAVTGGPIKLHLPSPENLLQLQLRLPEAQFLWRRWPLRPGFLSDYTKMKRRRFEFGEWNPLNETVCFVTWKHFILTLLMKSFYWIPIISPWIQAQIGLAELISPWHSIQSLVGFVIVSKFIYGITFFSWYCRISFFSFFANFFSLIICY